MNQTNASFESSANYIIEVFRRHFNVKTNLKLPEFVTSNSQKQSYIDFLSASENSLKIIFDYQQFHILDMSNNTYDVFGYSREEFDVPVFLKALVPEHKLFPVIANEWSVQIHSSIDKLNRHVNPKTCFCGFKIKSKDNSIRSLMCRMYYFETLGDPKNNYGKAVLTFDDITHLMKSDFWWARYSCGRHNEIVFYTHSTDIKYNRQDILSNREKEVLQLISKGLESKQIAAQLFISPETVEKHRKNMIARTGARDTTALMQLAKMASII